MYLRYQTQSRCVVTWGRGGEWFSVPRAVNNHNGSKSGGVNRQVLDHISGRRVGLNFGKRARGRDVIFAQCATLLATLVAPTDETLKRMAAMVGAGVAVASPSAVSVTLRPVFLWKALLWEEFEEPLVGKPQSLPYLG